MTTTSSPRRIRMASDVGGTFTDNICYDAEAGRITVAKVPTTPDNRARGTASGLREALAAQGASGAEVVYLGHGMTTATNAVIQRQGAVTAFLTNEGFRDLLHIGRQDRPHLYDIDSLRPAPLVPSALCFTVRGRLDHRGEALVPLDEEGLQALVPQLRAAGVQALAICFLHAYANPAHEQQARAVLQRLLPELTVCISSDILREFREYERSTTTVLNAFLHPVMQAYLGTLVDTLRDPVEGIGLPASTPVMVMEASGGMMTLKTARQLPVHTVLSGPAGGVVASAHVAALDGFEDLITMDIGGTSTDISLVRAGRVAITRHTSLAGIPVRIPVLDINAIGAGGGSIAWIDDGGALRVGPASAEAVPGPAAYGRGGERPTVTDANLVLGRLGTQTRLGGALRLDAQAAHQAIEAHIAGPLGLSVQEAASGMLRVTHANIVRGIRVVSVERGHDPRAFVLLPFGGAGPLHGVPVARELGMPRVLVPPTTGILCALGQLVSDLRHELVESCLGLHAELAPAQVLASLQRLHARADQLLQDDQVAPARRRFRYRADLRYLGQSHELTVFLPAADEAAWQALPALFHAEHGRSFGHAAAHTPVQLVSLGVVAEGLTAPPQLPTLPAGTPQPPAQARLGERPVYFESLAALRGGQSLMTPVWQRERLLAGNRIAGPAIVEEVSATTVLYPGDVATVRSNGSLIVELGHG